VAEACLLEGLAPELEDGVQANKGKAGGVVGAEVQRQVGSGASVEASQEIRRNGQDEIDLALVERSAGVRPVLRLREQGKSERVAGGGIEVAVGECGMVGVG
jgi:hypothetical protein